MSYNHLYAVPAKSFEEYKKAQNFPAVKNISVDQLNINEGEKISSNYNLHKFKNLGEKMDSEKKSLSQGNEDDKKIENKNISLGSRDYSGEKVSGQTSDSSAKKDTEQEKENEKIRLQFYPKQTEYPNLPSSDNNRWRDEDEIAAFIELEKRVAAEREKIRELEKKLGDSRREQAKSPFREDSREYTNVFPMSSTPKPQQKFLPSREEAITPKREYSSRYSSPRKNYYPKKGQKQQLPPKSNKDGGQQTSKLHPGAAIAQTSKNLADLQNSQRKVGPDIKKRMEKFANL